VVCPDELKVMSARSGRVMARAPLGPDATRRYGAPYWVIHRGDLQAVLRDAVMAAPAITLALGSRVQSVDVARDGVAVSAIRNGQRVEEHGDVLIAADGLWSALRTSLGRRVTPRFAGDTAWRALVPAKDAPAELRAPAVNLWLGDRAHLVHYPVQGGALINVVAIFPDDWREAGWNAPGQGEVLLTRYRDGWQPQARALLAAAPEWRRWALYDCAPLDRWGEGPTTLLGDAAHPMLPYLAQGAAMAIEDAAVLAGCLATKADAATALRRYESLRRPRTARVQQEARRNGMVYHLGGAATLLRSLALAAMGGGRLVTRYDWLYGWSSEHAAD
jgi:salicylate hydroxylase